jgi:hypothetical protein
MKSYISKQIYHLKKFKKSYNHITQLPINACFITVILE